jgi:cation diffusion facilitator CzcD-associated flavoprotein CzcO
MSANWPHHRSEQQQAMTDFAGQKLVVAGGSATGRDTAADLPSACSQPPLGGRRAQIEVRS